MALRPGRCLLTYYRKRAKMSQQTLARRLGVTQSMISQIENNERIMSYELAMNVADALNCNMDDLYVKEYYV